MRQPRIDGGAGVGVPRVSVVIPSYNTGRFIARAIESVVETGYPELEILVVEDGSTDDSLKRLAGMGAIRLLTHPGNRNRGIAASRNLGICEATGKYVAFLDADDAFLKNRFDTCIPMMEADSAIEAVVEPFYYDYVSGERAREMSGAGQGAEQRRSSVEGNATTQSPPGMFMDLLEGRNLPHTSSITIRKKIFRETGLFPPLKFCPEPPLWLRLFSRECVKAGSREPVSVYALHEDSTCAQHEKSAAFVFDYIAALMDAHRWMRRHEIKADYVAAIEQQAFGKFYHYCAGVTARPHSFWRDNVGAAARFAATFPEALKTAKFWKVAIRLIGAEVGLVKWK